jgi:hypothetical protein
MLTLRRMERRGKVERYRFTAADDETLKGFMLVAANVNLDAVDHKQFAEYAKRHDVYYWVMRYRGERFKIYAGRTNSLPRRYASTPTVFSRGCRTTTNCGTFKIGCGSGFSTRSSISIFWRRPATANGRPKFSDRRAPLSINEPKPIRQHFLHRIANFFALDSRNECSRFRQFLPQNSDVRNRKDRRPEGQELYEESPLETSLIPSARKPATDLPRSEGSGMGQIKRQFLLIFSGRKVRRKRN